MGLRFITYIVPFVCGIPVGPGGAGLETELYAFGKAAWVAGMALH